MLLCFILVVLRICVNNSMEMDETELHNNCNISDLESRRKVHMRNFMFKKKKNIVLKIIRI